MFILPQFEGERRERVRAKEKEREKRMGMAGCTFMVPNFPPRTSTSGKLSLTKGE